MLNGHYKIFQSRNDFWEVSFEYNISTTLIILSTLWKANTGLYQSKFVIEYLYAVRKESVLAIFL